MDKYYYRFDRNFTRVNSQGIGRFFGGYNTGNQLDSSAYMATFSDSNGAYSNDNKSVIGSPYNSTPEQFAAQQPSSDLAWFVDLGATSHITSNLNNLSLHSPYHGGDKVTVGNSKQLPITHVDTSMLNTNSNSFLCIPNILHVPSIHKNLLSVSQLIRDYNVVAEFHSNVCLIRDKIRGSSSVGTP